MVVLRTLWGVEGRTIGWETAKSNKVLWNRRVKTEQEIHRASRRISPEQVVYVYGTKNADIVKRLGHRVVLLHDDPFPDGKGDRVQDNGVELYHPWHYKHQMIKQALQDHGSLIYCDWDTSYHPNYFELAQRLLENMDKAFSMFMYRRTVRHPNRTHPIFRKCVASGSWLYFTNSEFVDKVLERMSQPGDRNWHDEYVMGDLLDEQYGGWMGEEEWLRKYESPVRCFKALRTPWGGKMKPLDAMRVTIDDPVQFTWHRIFA